MGSRLHTAAQNRQARDARGRQQFGRNRRYGGGTQLGDESPIHHCKRHAGDRVEENDDRLMRGQSALMVVRVDIYKLRPHQVAVDGWHEAHQAIVLRNSHDASDRLQNAS